MFAEEFNKIFEELREIENTLETENNCNKDKLSRRLIELRRSIDQFIGYWLGFEEKIWGLQEKFELDIPDQLDESLISAYLESSGLMEYLVGEESKSDKDILNELFSGYVEAEEDEEEEEEEKSEFNESEANKNHIETLKKGLGYYDLFMFDEAKKELEKVINDNPNLIIAHFYLALANAQKENYEESLKELRLVLALVKEDELKGVIYNLIGNIYSQKREFDKALINFNRACEANPNLFDAYFNLGATLFNLGEFNKSEKAFRKAMEIKSGDWETHLNLGKALSYQGKFKEALKHYKRALALNPKEGKIHFELGLVYQLLQHNDLAQKEYNKAKIFMKDKLMERK